QAVVLLVGLAVLIISLRVLPHPPSVISLNFLTVLFFLSGPLILTYAILQRLNALIRQRYLTFFISLQAFFAFIAVSAINHNRQVLERRFQDMMTKTDFVNIFITQPAADAKQLTLIIQDYFWCVAVFTAMMALWGLIRAHGWWIVRGGKASYYD